MHQLSGEKGAGGRLQKKRGRFRVSHRQNSRPLTCSAIGELSLSADAVLAAVSICMSVFASDHEVLGRLATPWGPWAGGKEQCGKSRLVAAWDLFSSHFFFFSRALSFLQGHAPLGAALPPMGPAWTPRDEDHMELALEEVNWV